MASQEATGIARTERGLTIAGTRVTLYALLDYLRDGWPPHLIREWLDVTDGQLAAALDYIAHHQAEVEAEYQQVLQQADASRRYWEERNREHFARVAALPPSPQKAALYAKLAERRARRDTEQTGDEETPAAT